MAQEPSGWSLADLYASPEAPEISAALERALEWAKALGSKYRGKLASLEAPALKEALVEYEALLELSYRPQLYAMLLFSGQTDDDQAQGLLSRARQASTLVQNELKFFEVELKTLPEDRYQALVSSSVLATYRHYLGALRRFAPHTLSEAEERALEVKNLTGRSAFDQLYTEVTSKLRIPLELEGGTRELTVAEARALRSSPDREVRRRAVDGLMKAFEEESHVLNFCLNTLLQDHALESKARRYETLWEPTFLEDELSLGTVETLMRAVEAQFPLVQRYLRLKRKALGLSDFGSHDVLAPISAEPHKVSFSEAQELVLDAYASFDPRFSEIAQKFFAGRWIDVMPRPGKRDGAFCSGGLPGLHPYVLVNFAERLEDVSTLAHELGHGIHFYLSRRNTLLNFWATTPMAETASVFGELILMDRLAKKAKDSATRRALLALRIEDIVSTVFNQVSYTRWEQRAHLSRLEGFVPAERLGALWLEERRRLYGDSVRLTERDRWSFLSIGHFVHYRFYCYSYAFGQLLVLALFQKYQEQGQAFVPHYLELLSSGCSKSPQELLGPLGVDLEDPAFWAGGFETLKGLLDEFEALV